MDRIRVLIVSYYFPPAAGGGVQRAVNWAKYLPRFGVDVHVLAPDDPGWIQQGGMEPPAGISVHRARNRSPRSLVPAEEIARRSGPARLLRKLSLQPRRLLFPDIHIGWSLAAVPAGRRIVRDEGIDIIISTSPPKTTHVIASRIASATGARWVADFRDSWLDLPHLRLDRRSVRVRQMLNVRYARKLMRRAELITTVSEPLADDLRRRHPSTPVAVVPNGIDRELLDALPAPPELAGGRSRAETFVVSYTGNFFGRQSPQTFLAAVSDLLQRRPELAARIVVRFVGQLKPTDHTRIDGDEFLQRVVQRVDFLPHLDVLAEQRAADLLFLYVAPGRGSQGVFTGKVFEYIAAARPVLALLPHGNVSADLLRRAGTGTVVDPDDVAGAATALEREIDQWLTDGRRRCHVSEAMLEEVSRERQTEAFAAQLIRLVRPAGEVEPEESRARTT